MIKDWFYGGLELFYNIIQGTLLESNNEKVSQIQRWLFIFSIFGMLSAFIFFTTPVITFFNFSLVFKILNVTAPIWAPLALGAMFIGGWMRYIRTDYINKAGSVLLEVRIPKETMKSPLAMELFFTSLFQTGSATYIQTYWNGNVRPWFSFEIVSTGGQIKFYIWSFKKFRNLIESQIYAQYPNVEIHESEDYMSWVPHEPDPVNIPMWATYFKFSKASVYPIKTYVDYGLHEDPKEEFKIDPMTSVLEYLGSMRKGENVWIQILIQAHRGVKLKDGVLFAKGDWKEKARHEIEKIREESVMEKEGSEFPGMPNPTKGQQNTIAAIEKSVSKFPFDACIRGCYIATKETFNNIGITGLIGSFRQYSSNDDLNGFKLGWFTDYDYPWQDFRRIRRTRAEKEMMEAFKLRSFFQPPFKNFEQVPIILNTEELATIFHFPGSVAATPSLERIASKRSQAPSNLPI
ncbi:MAG: hypothetical protein EXS46_02275 [Candidatus Taylorbacteria bacterium]|nr:hypothetical protein [Candidatus Taylorbacteria bacterium]